MSKHLLQTGYWNPYVEKMPRDELQRLQWKRLKAAVSYAWANSPFYRRKMNRAGLTPDDVNEMGVFVKKLPPTTRKELEEDQVSNPPFGSRIVAGAETLRYHQTSGTTGSDPLRALDSERDWIWGAECWASSLYNFGVRETDRVALAFGYGTFIGFWGAHYAFEKIGCTVFPMGGMGTEARLRLIMDLGITTIACTPSYALRVAFVAKEKGIALAKDTRIDKLVLAGEPGASMASARGLLEETYDASVGDFMGTTETAGIIAFTCSVSKDMPHLNEDRFLTECLDPSTWEGVGYGERGVLAVTPLVKQRAPLLRYVTNDAVSRIGYQECKCGRTFDMLKGGVLARYDDAIKVRGIVVTPQIIESVLREFRFVEEFHSTIENIDGLDTLVVRVEHARPSVPQELERERQDLVRRLKEVLGMTPIVEWVPQGTLPRFELKAKRLKDMRVR